MRTSLLICTFFSLTNSFGQKPDKDIFINTGYSRQYVNLNFEKACKGKMVIKRKNKSLVTFMFFQTTSDTVEIYINEKKVMERYIIHDSDLISTNYTGVDFTYEYPGNENKITILYRKQKSYIAFSLNKKFPFYGIYFLEDKKIYVSGRKYQITIK